VARHEDFAGLAKIAMQIASNPIFQWFHQTTFQNQKKEVRQFESGKEDLQNKPEEIRNKIVEGRIEKSLKKQVLLDQEYIRDPNITVDEYIKQVVGILGENIRVARLLVTY
jgi:elongation factor Ts